MTTKFNPKSVEKNQNKVLAIRFTETNYGEDCHYADITASVECSEDGEIRGLPLNADLYAQIHVSAMISRKYPQWKGGNFKIYASPGLSLELREAVRFAYVLDRIETRMDRIRQSLGPTDSFGEYLARFCMALGLDTCVLYNVNYNPTESALHYVSPQDARVEVNQRIDAKCADFDKVAWRPIRF